MQMHKIDNKEDLIGSNLKDISNKQIIRAHARCISRENRKLQRSF